MNTTLKMKIIQGTCFLIALKVVASFSLTNNVSDNNELENVLTVSDTKYAAIGEERCMGVLGCFSITPDFYHGYYRPVNLLPMWRDAINTRFHLYTRAQPKTSHEIYADDPEAIAATTFKPSFRTVFVVHGFVDHMYYGKWMEKLKDSFLRSFNYNVIIVDWSEGNFPSYIQSTANTRVVGAEIALMIKNMQKFLNADPMNCYIVGHSLGAHIAGYAGERLNGTLGRITALDPAGPFFQNMPPSVRLDPTDADFVDAIHTDSKSKRWYPLGMTQAIGHVDFYPNDGGDQPGCNPFVESFHSIMIEGLFEGVRRFMSCNHQRSVDFFQDSLDNQLVLPVAHWALSWESYAEGKYSQCGYDGARCAALGIEAERFRPHKNDSKSVKMYLATEGGSPFWENILQIKIKLKKPRMEDYTDKSGEIHLNIKGSEHTYRLKLTPNSGNLIHGSTYYFLIRKPYTYRLGSIEDVHFSWKAWYSFFQKYKLFLEYVQITPMNMADGKKQRAATKAYCERSNFPIESGKVTKLVICSKNL